MSDRGGTLKGGTVSHERKGAANEGDADDKTQGNLLILFRAGTHLHRDSGARGGHKSKRLLPGEDTRPDKR